MELSQRYQEYIDCLNRRDLGSLHQYVDADVIYNGEPVGLDGYRAMLERNYEEIPDLRFHIQLVVAESPHLGAVLRFDCHPAAEFLGLPVHGRQVVFSENVFYRFGVRKIQEVWSIIDKAQIEATLRS